MGKSEPARDVFRVHVDGNVQAPSVVGSGVEDKVGTFAVTSFPELQFGLTQALTVERECAALSCIDMLICE